MSMENFRRDTRVCPSTREKTEGSLRLGIPLFVGATTRILAVIALSLCLSIAVLASIDGDDDGARDRDAGEHTTDTTPEECSRAIGRAFARDDGRDLDGQAILDKILRKYGYAAGILQYGTDNLKRTQDTERKLKRKRHKARDTHDKVPD